MRFLPLIMFSNFIQVINSAREYYTKNEYIFMYILFSTIYLLQGHQLNHDKYPKNEIIMRDFVQATEYGAHMYEIFYRGILHKYKLGQV
jgi:hypothetical protein